MSSDKNNTRAAEKCADGAMAAKHSNSGLDNTNSLVSNRPAAAPIHKLNDCCYQHIFSFLPFIEREKKTIVCKRWKRIIRNMWRLQHELDTISGIPFEIPKKHRNVGFLKKLLKRFQVKKLTLQGNKIKSPNGIMADIANRCTALEEASFYTLNMQGYKLNLLAKYGNLKKLILYNCEGIRDSNLKFVLKDNRTLTHLEITNSEVKHESLRGRFLKSLHAPLETLILCCHKYLRIFYLRENKQLPSTLKHLNLSALENFDCESDLYELVECYPKLCSLTIAKYDQFEDHCMDMVTNLKDLESLNLSFNKNLHVSILEEILEKCPQLKSLDISGSDIDQKIAEEKESDFNISALNTLPNLVSLNLSFLKQMACSEITKYASKSPPIERLYLIELPGLEDHHVKSLFTLCHQLKHLDLSRCPKITDATVKAANEALKLRANNQPLHLVIGGTKIQKPSRKNKASQLKSKNHPLLSISYDDSYNVMSSYYIHGQKNVTPAEEDDVEKLIMDEWMNKIKNFIGCCDEKNTTPSCSTNQASNSSGNHSKNAANNRNKDQEDSDDDDAEERRYARNAMTDPASSSSEDEFALHAPEKKN